jgi:hypothetical protein
MPHNLLTCGSKAANWAVAIAVVALALAISPIGIRLATGRLDLSFRVFCLSVAADLFLLILAGAVIATGRVRQFFFYALVLAFPLAALAAIEVGAIAIDLANRVAPIEDTSILTRKDRWPSYLMSNARLVAKDGLTLYRPWQSDGILINEFGLRTAPPMPKKTGERRIALTGGSVAWGWRVLDADTIAARLQQTLHQHGHTNVTVYNFGIEAVRFADELALVKRFRSLYSIDQVVFFTGANDATYSYLAEAAPQNGFQGMAGGANAFELVKATGRLVARWGGGSPSMAARFDDQVLPMLARHNTLREGLIEAGEYCRATMIVCDVMLQPMLLTRKVPRGSEVEIARTLRQIYPRYETLIATIYRTARGTGISVQDLSTVFDQHTEPFFVDAAHINEAGNQVVAERIATLIAAPAH